MIGGKVIGVVRKPENTLLHVQDNPPNVNDVCSVRCVDGGRINVGDSVWWQAGKVLWTPADKSVRDFQFPKVGYSH